MRKRIALLTLSLVAATWPIGQSLTAQPRTPPPGRVPLAELDGAVKTLLEPIGGRARTN